MFEKNYSVEAKKHRECETTKREKHLEAQYTAAANSRIQMSVQNQKANTPGVLSKGEKHPLNKRKLKNDQSSLMKGSATKIPGASSQQNS